MNSIVIVAPFSYEDEFRKKLSIFHETREAQGQFVISSGNSRAYLQQNTSTEDESEPEQVALYRSAMPTPIYYILEYNDRHLACEVILAIADDPRLVVDNDHGTILQGAEFVHQIRGGKQLIY